MIGLRSNNVFEYVDEFIHVRDARYFDFYNTVFLFCNCVPRGIGYLRHDQWQFVFIGIYGQDIACVTHAYPFMTTQKSLNLNNVKPGNGTLLCHTIAYIHVGWTFYSLRDEDVDLHKCTNPDKSTQIP